MKRQRYSHKIITFGDQTKADSINIGYSTNFSKYDLEKTLENDPLHFSPAGVLSVNKDISIDSLDDFRDKNLVARLRIRVDRNHAIKHNINSFKKICGPEIYIKIPKNYELFALNERARGHDVKTLGSLIMRTIRATSVKDGNLFLHACAIVDPDINAFYIIASDRDHTGKTPVTNSFLADMPNGKLLTTALRLRVREVDGTCFAYPQQYGKNENIIYTLVSKEEQRLFKLYCKKSLEDIGFNIVHGSKQVLSLEKILMSIKGYNEKIDLSKYKTFFIWTGRKLTCLWDKPIAIASDDIKNKLIDSWLSTWQFGWSRLFDKINMHKFDEMKRCYTNYAKILAEKVTNKIDYFINLEGLTRDAKYSILVESCRTDYFEHNKKNLKWWYTNAPKILRYIKIHFKRKPVYNKDYEQLRLDI